MWRRHLESKKNSPWKPPYNPNQPRNMPPNNPTSRQPPTQDKKDGTGITYGGQGKAMDLDAAKKQGLCFHCGTKGHMARFCPNKQTKAQVIRNLLLNVTDEEKGNIAKELGFSIVQSKTQV